MLGRLIGTVRRNHGLEHATITVMLPKLGRTPRLVGRATGNGFFIYGAVPRELIEEASREALRRLQSGEGHLAVSPMCGTNIAVAGVLAGLSSMLALGDGKRRWQSAPNVFLASMLALVLAQPLGRWVQQYLTTSPDLSDTEIVRTWSLGRYIHKVETRRRPA